MNRLAQLSLANRALILLITLSVVAFGLLATTSAKRELMPELELPMVMVNAQYDGASPQVVEKQVTEPLEQAVKGVSGITNYTSTSSNGNASLVAEFDYGDDTEAVVRSTQQAVDQVGQALPDGVEPSVMSFSFDDMPVLMLAAGAGDGDEQALAEPLEEQLIPDLESIDGVRGAELTGVRDSTVTVTPDEDALEDENLTPADLTSALQASGVMSPGGSVTEDDRTLTVTTGGRLESIEDIEDVQLLPGGGGAPAAEAPPGSAPGAAPGPAPTPADPVRLKDVAEVELTADEQTTLTRTDGNPSLGVMVTKTPEGNTVEISEAVQERVDELAPLLGADTEISVVWDQAPYITDSIVAMTEEGGLGLAFAVLVILLFLLSLRSTLVAAVSIPTSLLAAMIGVQVFGYSLNILTLGALTVSVGRVVDDSIVVLENIKRHLGYGEEKLTAVLTGVREVATAVTSSTLATIAVFLPVAFVGGQTGELFRPFAVTVSLALAASLLVALTIVPVLAYWFSRTKVVPPEEVERLRAEEQRRELRTPLQRAYLPVLRWTTRHRAVTLVAAAVLFIGTIALLPNVKTDFIGDDGQNTYLVNQELPTSTSLARADEEAEKVEAKLEGLSWVESYQVSLGSSDPFEQMMGGGVDTTQYTITANPDSDQEEVQEKLRTALSDVDTDTELSLDETGGMGAGLEVEVRADESETLEEAAELVEDTFRDIPGAEDVENNLTAAQPALEVQVDEEKAAEEGLTEGQVGEAVSEAFQGADVGTATIGDVERDMVVRGEEKPDSVSALEDLEIAAPGGEVRLAEVADVEEVTQPPELTRADGARSATVSAAPTADDLGAVSAELVQELDRLDLPDGATATLGGVSADQEEAFIELGVAMLAAIVLVFLIMVATFNSLVQPLVLLVSIPFAATGSLGLLVLTGVPLGLPALIGMLMLIGIVVSNAIVLIDLINQYRGDGMELGEAVIEGARHRLRPILMTAMATMCALVPMALGITGGGAFIAAPLALVVIGGLLTSTLLTLVLVPVLYTMTEARKERRRQRRIARREAKLAAARAGDEGADDPSREVDTGGGTVRE